MVDLHRDYYKKKKKRININGIKDFKEALIDEGYNINGIKDENFKESISELFSIDSLVVDKLYKIMTKDNITYRAKSIDDFIDYIKTIMLYEEMHERLCNKIKDIDKLYIERVEYERVTSSQDSIDHMLETIEEVKSSMVKISEHGVIRINALEEEIAKNYLYAKDIELLKKIVISNNRILEEDYDEENRIKTISFNIPEVINYDYIPVKIGTLEYHEHLNKDIPRMKRLIKNIDKYMEDHEEGRNTFKINQSLALQDSINIALAIFDNREFKAISGSNDIENYCKAPALEEARFKSNKVNKLGKLGVGYNRVNDSEKKILEEIHRLIEKKELSDEGKLILYSKWEPCPSCCFVISQFCEKYPKIKIEVEYHKSYGE